MFLSISHSLYRPIDIKREVGTPEPLVADEVVVSSAEESDEPEDQESPGSIVDLYVFSVLFFNRFSF